MKKQKIKNKEFDLNKKLNDLQRENDSLKNKLSKLRKDLTKTHDALAVNQEYAAKEIEIEKKEKIKKCDHCNGEIKRFKILDIVFDVCQKCKSREKIKEKNS